MLYTDFLTQTQTNPMMTINSAGYVSDDFVTLISAQCIRLDEEKKNLTNNKVLMIL